MAIHFLPIALGVFPCLPISAGLQAKIPLKWILVMGEVLAFVGSALLPFANSNSPERYWRYTFPGFLLGTVGAGLIYLTANIALLAVTPPSISGIVSAVFMATLQTSAATGVAIITSIQTSVQPDPISFKGRAAGLWFLVAFIGFILILTLVLMKDTVGPVTDPDSLLVKGNIEHNVETVRTKAMNGEAENKT
jgi:MFS family permease